MKKTFAFAAVAGLALGFVCSAEAGWPVVKTYENEFLRKVKMPMGGIGTGTISLSGRGQLVDWEIRNRPAKGAMNGKTHFAIRCETADGRKVARVLEGPIPPEDYEGDRGCTVANSGMPHFRSAVFKAAYPLARIDFADPKFPLTVSLEAMNPLVPGDADASGIPAVLMRYRVRNPTGAPVKVSVSGLLERLAGVETCLVVAPGTGEITSATKFSLGRWKTGIDAYWRRFLAVGTVGDDSFDGEPGGATLQCVSATLAAGEEKTFPFVIAWRAADRKAWTWNEKDFNASPVVGNYYATRFPTARAAADRLLADLPALEAKTVAFVEGILAKRVPDVVKEAALFNLSTLRTETCHRTADGNFFGWEGVYDGWGSCPGNCTHVWGYEHALVDLWPDLARRMLDLEFGPQMGERGDIANRVFQPVATAARKEPLSAADGQMQCIVKACEYWRKSGDDAWLKRTWPNIRKAISFCWIPNGWDGDRDGVMEGCQHNTMDVEYYGPNPQMEFLYLAALEAEAAMAAAQGDGAFADTCRDLCAKGKAWTEANLFNGAYYEHKVVPPKGEIPPGLRHSAMGARDLADPDYQLAAGCLIDQLLGDYAARAVGLAPVADPAHARTTLATILEKCRKAPDDDHFNPMRDFAMPGEESLRMAWYPADRIPRKPFPYYVETMTGFEYVVAALEAMHGDKAAAERIVRNIRDRYDGRKRNPFDEAECGHHYARALAAWTVMKVMEDGK